MMRKVLKSAVPFMVCILFFGACAKNSGHDTGYTGLANMEFRLPEGSTDQNASAEEGVKSLRVVLLTPENQGERKIIKNIKIYPAGENPLLADKIKIYDIYEGRYDLLFFANEESVGMEYTDEAILSGIDGNSKLLFVDEGRVRFPLTRDALIEGGKGLPMSCKIADLEVREGMDPINVELRRAVAKVKVNIENSISDPMNVEQIMFGPFFNDRLYVFPERNLDVPETAQYAEAVFGEQQPLGIQIDPGKSGNFEFYLYPSFYEYSGTGDYPYEIGFIIDGRTYNRIDFVGENGLVNSLGRNVILNINARISSKAEVSVSFEVSRWETSDVEVPPFEIKNF